MLRPTDLPPLGGQMVKVLSHAETTLRSKVRTKQQHSDRHSFEALLPQSICSASKPWVGQRFQPCIGPVSHGLGSSTLQSEALAWVCHTRMPGLKIRPTDSRMVSDSLATSYQKPDAADFVAFRPYFFRIEGRTTMGRRKQDPKKLDARGSYLEHPSRKPKGFDPTAPAPAPVALPPAPSHLRADAKKVWNEYAPKVSPHAVIGEGDISLFEQWVSLKTKSRKSAGLNAAQDRHLTDLTKKFFATASDNAAAAPPPQSKLDEFLARKRAHDAANSAPLTNEQCAQRNQESLDRLDAIAAANAAEGITGAQRLERLMAKDATKREAK